MRLTNKSTENTECTIAKPLQKILNSQTSLTLKYARSPSEKNPSYANDNLYTNLKTLVLIERNWEKGDIK